MYIARLFSKKSWHAWKQTKTKQICKIIDWRHVFVHFTYSSDCWKRGLNRLHVCLTIIRAHFIGIPGPQQRWETRNTEHLCAFHLLRKSVNHKNTTVKSETETQQQKNKNKKKPLINLKVEELHLDGHTQNTPQPQEIQNNGTATSCSRRTFYQFTCVITLAGCWENTLSILLSENKL